MVTRSSMVNGGFGVWIGVVGAGVSDRGPRRLGEGRFSQ